MEEKGFQNQKSREIPSVFKTILKMFGMIIITISLVFNLFTHVLSLVRYYGESMGKEIDNGDILIINRLADIDRGDIVAFYYNNKVLVRRVIAKGGDIVEIDAFGKVIVNGIELDETYADNITLGQCNIAFPMTIGEGEYFVLGDDRAISMDSRLAEIGNISEDRIIGQLLWQ